jgi:hypothetical protein
MEPENPLLFSQQPATGLCSETHVSIHALPAYFPNIHSNIILPSTPRSFVLSLPFRFSNQNFLCISHSINVRYI